MCASLILLTFVYCKQILFPFCAQTSKSKLATVVTPCVHHRSFLFVVVIIISNSSSLALSSSCVSSSFSICRFQDVKNLIHFFICKAKTYPECSVSIHLPNQIQENLCMCNVVLGVMDLLCSKSSRTEKNGARFCFLFVRNQKWWIFHFHNNHSRKVHTYERVERRMHFY